MRRDTSSVSCSLNWAGALRARLSIWIATSALLRPGRLLVPEKITSSMSAARSDLCEVSPITQRSASTRFDLPQPFGPTTPVSPGSISKSVGSTNDLKPISRRRVSFMGQRSPSAGAAVGGLLPRSAYGDSSSRTAASRGTMNRRVIQSKIPGTLLRKFSPALHRSNGQNDASALSRQGKKPLSALEIAVDLLADIGRRRIACELLAIDEKSG